MIVNWTIGNKFQWNLNQNSNIFIQENAFENVTWKMAAILSLMGKAVLVLYSEQLFYLLLPTNQKKLLWMK